MASSAPEKPVARVAQELVASSGFLLARLGLGFKSRALARLEQAGFDPYDYSVLAILDEGASKAQATIADAVAVDPSRLVALLDSLEDRGLITRRRDPDDRRRHAVSITPDGKEQLLVLRGIAKEVEDEFLAPLDPESREMLYALLLQLVAHHDPRCAFKPAEAPSET